VEGFRALFVMNHEDCGFDCPGCAWPDDPSGLRLDLCENGVNHVTWELAPATADRDFFAEHTVGELEGWSDYALEDVGRLAEPLSYKAATNKYEPISWDEAFALVGDTLRALESPDEAAFYTSGRLSNEATFRYLRVTFSDSDLDKAGLVGVDDSLHAVTQVELLKNASNVRLDGAIADHKLGSDLGVREAAGKEPKHFELARGQFVELLRKVLAPAWCPRVFRDDRASDRWVEECVTPRDDFHAGEQLLRGCVLEEKPAGAGAERLVDVFGEAEGREDEDTRRRLANSDPSCCLEPVDARHADVHKSHIRLQPLHRVDHLDPVTRFPNDFDLRIDLEQLPKAGADERLVVGDHYADAQRDTGSNGSRAFTL
jgi:hypothetical protein